METYVEFMWYVTCDSWNSAGPTEVCVEAARFEEHNRRWGNSKHALVFYNKLDEVVGVFYAPLRVLRGAEI